MVNKKSHGRIEEIEALRAVAILFILFIHIPSYLLIWKPDFIVSFFLHFTTQTGVDLFFVISGFVIARDLIPRLQTATNFKAYAKQAGAFWMRRCWRILPSAWLWIGIYLILVATLPNIGAFGNFQENLRDMFAAFFQYDNFHISSCIVGDLKGHCGDYQVFWSLSLEEQFYLLLPIATFVFRKHLTKFLIVALVFQLCIDRPYWTLAWVTRTDEFILGVLLAIWYQHQSYQRFEPKFLLKWPPLKWILISGSFVLGFYLDHSEHHIYLYASYVSLLCFIPVYLASYGKGYFLTEGQIRKVAMWIGARSYALYLCHLVVFKFVIEIWFVYFPKTLYNYTGQWLVLTLIALFFVFIISDLNYRFIEQPLRNIGRKISDKILR